MGVQALPVGAPLEAERGAATGERVPGDLAPLEQPLPQRGQQRRLAGSSLAHDQDQPRAAAAAEVARLLERHRVGGRHDARRRRAVAVRAARGGRLQSSRARAISSSRSVWTAISIAAAAQVADRRPWARAVAIHSWRRSRRTRSSSTSGSSVPQAAAQVRIGSSGSPMRPGHLHLRGARRHDVGERELLLGERSDHARGDRRRGRDLAVEAVKVGHLSACAQ